MRERWQWAIPPQLDWAEPFSEGVAAAAASEGKRGFVDRAGGFVIPPTFAEVHSFSGGLALAYQEPCKPLFIDHSDLELVDVDPDDPFDFSIDRWNDQLVTRYSKNTPNRGLKAHMPDHSDLNRQTANKH